MSVLAIVGAGYVGLVTGACFAQKGHHVIIIENNIQKIEYLLQGKVPFYEPGLDTIVKEALTNKNLIFETSIARGLKHKPSIIFSCVGTPSLPDGGADLSYVEQVARDIGNNITEYIVVVNKSTVPVGTAQKVKSIIQSCLDTRNAEVLFDVASNPEFLKEGDAVRDFLYPDRIVVGVQTEIAAQLLHALYKPFITDEAQFLRMNIESAELTKYASNTMLALRISFMNQLAHLADIVGADIAQVKQGMAMDKRIGSSFLNAGIGYGGSCFPKDVKALVHMGNENHFPMTLVQEIDNINTFQRIWFINRINTYYGPQLANKTVGIWGLAFKPETDDIRCAPSIDLIDNLLQQNAKIIAYDFAASDNIKALYKDAITYAQSAKEVLEKADFLVILTEWKEFLQFSPHDFLFLKDKVVFDGRNCFDPQQMRDAGVMYLCVGKNSASKQQKKLAVASQTTQQYQI